MNSIKKTWSEISIHPKTVREFGFILTGVLLLFPFLGNLIGVIFKAKAFHYWLGWPVVSVIVLLINLFVPSLMRLIYQIAMFIAHGISWVMMRLILGIFFYLVLSPVSLAMRALGRDLLDQKIDKNQTTYWKKRTVRVTREQYERLF